MDLSLSRSGEKMKAEARWLKVKECMGGKKVLMQVNTVKRDKQTDRHRLRERERERDRERQRETEGDRERKM